VGGVEAAHRLAELSVTGRRQVPPRQLLEKPLANPEPELAGRLARERDGRDARDGNGRAPGGGRDHLDEAVDEDRGLARPRALI